jgi:hypothetical protein
MGVARRDTSQVQFNWQKPQAKSMESPFSQPKPKVLPLKPKMFHPPGFVGTKKI